MPRGSQPSFWRGPISILPHFSSLNLVQRLGHRELTGRDLGVLVHSHSHFRIHLELRGVLGSRSFERRLPDYKSMARFTVSLLTDAPEGLCACIVMLGWDREGRYWPELPGSDFCIQALRNVPRAMAVVRSTREVDETEEERRWRKNRSCDCTVISSAVLVDYY